MVDVTRSVTRKSSLDFGDTRQDLNTLFGVRSALDAGAQRQVDLEGATFDLEQRRRAAGEGRNLDRILGEEAAGSPRATSLIRRIGGAPGGGAPAQQLLAQQRELEDSQDQQIIEAAQSGNDALYQTLKLRFGRSPIPPQFEGDLAARAGVAAALDEAGKLYKDDPAKATQYVRARLSGMPVDQAIQQTGDPSPEVKQQMFDLMLGDQRVLGVFNPQTGGVTIATDPSGQPFQRPATGQGQQASALEREVEYLIRRFGYTPQQALQIAQQSASNPAWLDAEKARQRRVSDLTRQFFGRITPEIQQQIDAAGQAEFDRFMDLAAEQDPSLVRPVAPATQPQVGAGLDFQGATSPQIPAAELQSQTQQTVAPAAAPTVQQPQTGQARRRRFVPGVGIVGE